jgi:hypothetical protein
MNHQKKRVVAVDNSQLINQDSGIVEYYTPVPIIEAARKVMGSIDLDPTSSDIANLYVNAPLYYTRENDSFNKDWHGNVWFNPPFTRGEKPCIIPHDKCKKKTCVERGYHNNSFIPSTADWVDKIIYQYLSGRINQACVITFANTSESWAQKLLGFPVCFFKGRTHYFNQYGEEMTQAPKGSMVAYMGCNNTKFRTVFKELGQVKI